ncbi:hypothetical protein J2797_004014 [Paraburkholderia terricola]|nr:hypothetical protein [Paraburkholderia terricola]MDR6494111.1 hypothetical protein [Paraburkholderia terricola]
MQSIHRGLSEGQTHSTGIFLFVSFDSRDELS